MVHPFPSGSPGAVALEGSAQVWVLVSGTSDTLAVPEGKLFHVPNCGLAT